jgi:hypothetical protein
MVLAIECDGAAYHSSQSARDRDRLRQEQLERLGWTFHRIWSQDWFTQRQAEIERARAAYDAAVQAADEESHSDQEKEQAGTSAAAEGDPRDPAGVDPGPTAPGGVGESGGTDRGPCPMTVGRPNIDDYYDRELVELIRWIESDTLLRTREQLLDEAIRELGFRRRGKKIVSSLEGAISEAHHETA